ncbi:MAG: polymer-forming cytoskeletal protein [Candidatus Rariloculaceae bacterium]
MLGKKKSSRTAVKSFVGADTRVHGDIEFTGGFHVDGYVKGNIEGLKDDAAVLSISETGCVEGSVVVPHILLNGVVRGDVRATERVELGPGARVVGNVQYKLIEMAIGAEVNGKLIHENERQTDESQASRPEVGIVSAVKAAGD